MKTSLGFAVLKYLVLITCMEHFGLAAPTLQTNNLEDVPAVLSDVKRGAENRNAHFGAYLCHIQKATNVVVKKLQTLRVSYFECSNIRT